MTEERLAREWLLHYAAHKQETIEVYNITVRGGNKQTYSEFVEEIRKEWMEEMKEK